MDTAASLYTTGFDLMRYDELELATERLLSVYQKYTQNQTFAPKALYTLGYMFEHRIEDFDSAAKYYGMVIEQYPKSEYAEELQLAVLYKDLMDNDEQIPDSLKTKEVSLYTADTSLIYAPYDSTLLATPKSKKEFSFEDLKNPSKLIEKTKKKIQEQIDKAKEITGDDSETLLQKGREAAEQMLKDGINIPKPEDFMPEKIEPDEEKGSSEEEKPDE